MLAGFIYVLRALNGVRREATDGLERAQAATTLAIEELHRIAHQHELDDARRFFEKEGAGAMEGRLMEQFKVMRERVEGVAGRVHDIANDMSKLWGWVERSRKDG